MFHIGICCIRTVICSVLSGCGNWGRGLVCSWGKCGDRMQIKVLLINVINDCSFLHYSLFQGQHKNLHAQRYLWNIFFKSLYAFSLCVKPVYYPQGNFPKQV